MKRLFCLFLLLFLSLELFGDVFSLWPFHGGGGHSASSGESVTGILDPKKLWDENVVINGHSMTMGVSLVDLSLKDALHLLRGKYPDVPVAVNSNSVLMEVPLNNEMRRRIFLVAFDGISSILQFTMDIPKNNIRKAPPQWPPELPLPPGAKPLTVMRFPARKSWYGMFSSPFGKGLVVRDLSENLRAGGWESAGRESEAPFASGDVFLSRDGSRLMIIGVQEQKGTDSSFGTIYLRDLK